MSNDCRQDLLQRLGSGEIKVLTSCALIGEGVDVPSVGGCILLRPTESVGLHLQMIGRCLRPQSGKRAVVLDHVGNTLRLGHHLEDRQWSLDGIKKRDSNAAPSVKVCPVCFATSPSAVQACEECGNIFPAPERHELKQVDGELVVLHNNQIKSMIVEKDFLQDKDKEFLFGNPVMVKGSYRNNNHTGWKSGILVRLIDPGNKAKRIKSQKVFISRNNYGEDKLLCEVLTDEGLITCEPRDLAPTAHKNKAEIAKAQTLDELQKIERKRGYKRGWAERVYEARLAKRHGA